MTEISRAVDRTLRPTESCVAAVETRFLVGDARHKRTLAIVTHRPEQNEHAVFFMRWRRFPATGLAIDGFLPLYDRAQGRCVLRRRHSEATDELIEVTMRTGTPLLMECVGEGAVCKIFMSEAMTASQIAQQHAGPTYAWLGAYFTQKRVEPGLPARFFVSAAELGVAGEDAEASAATVPEAAVPPPQRTPPAPPEEQEQQQQQQQQPPAGEEPQIRPPPVASSPRVSGVGSPRREGESVLIAAGTQAVKEAWVRKRLRALEKDFVEHTAVSFYVGTYNVNESSAGPYLGQWLAGDGGAGALPVDADVVAIGLQEVDMSAQSLVLGDVSASKPWEDEIDQALAKCGKYMRIASRQLVGMLILVYIQEQLAPHIRRLCVRDVGVGVLGVMGNKGATAVRFDLYDSEVCLVNCHLAAHQSNMGRRNQDYEDIATRIEFVVDDLMRPETETLLSIFDHDVVLWFGDLNYRIDLDNAECRRLCALKDREADLKALLDADQLRKQQAAGLAFKEFMEGPIAFAPTYKFDAGTDDYDSSEKQRIPSWTDRVLWRGRGVHCLRYTRTERAFASDHKPVHARLSLQAKVVNAKKHRAAYAKVVKELDRMENECLPDASLSRNFLDFGDIRFMEPQSLTTVLKNTGQVPVQFRFIPKLDEAAVCQPWLRIAPRAGVLLPGEAVSIRLQMQVDEHSAADLNAVARKSWPSQGGSAAGKGDGDGDGGGPTAPCDDIVILHLENGKDHFVSITGRFRSTCFATSLDDLVALRHRMGGGGGGQARLCIPRELWRLTDVLFRTAMDTSGLFLRAGLTEECAQLRASMDSGADLANYRGSPHSVAETLLTFLGSLPEAVVPTAEYLTCLDASTSYADSCAALKMLPQVNYNVFVYVTAFLRELLAPRHAARNRLTARDLAVMLSAVLLRPPPGLKPADAAARRRKQALFVEQFIAEGPV